MMPDYLLEAFNEAKLESRTTFALPAALFGFILLITFFVGCIGVLLRKSWSKLVFTIPAVLIHLLHPLLGIGLLGPWTAVFDSLLMIISGFVIAMIYYSNVNYFANDAAS